MPAIVILIVMVVVPLFGYAIYGSYQTSLDYKDLSNRYLVVLEENSDLRNEVASLKGELLECQRLHK